MSNMYPQSVRQWNPWLKNIYSTICEISVEKIRLNSAVSPSSAVNRILDDIGSLVLTNDASGR
jgi:hypothetical protein